MTLADLSRDGPLVVFDGFCSLCTWSIRFIVRNDRTRALRFTTAQSSLGVRLLEANGISSIDPETFILISDGRVFQKSDAAIKLAARLGPWRVLGFLGLLPRPIRDRLYLFVARNRYKWFGRQQACYVPTKAEQDRFIEDYHG